MRTALASLLALAVSVPLAAPASATVFIYGNGSAIAIDPVFGVESQSLPFSHQFSSTETYVFGVATPLGSAVATGQADDGWMRVATSASGAVGAVAEGFLRVGGASYEVYAGFSDTLTIDAPGLTGQAATARIGIELEGTLSAAGLAWPDASTINSRGDANFSLYGPGTFAHQVAVSTDEQSGLNPGEFVQHFLGGTAQIVFGTPFTIDFVVALNGTAGAGSDGEEGPGLPATATMIADFQNTFTWVGIQDLRDESGAPVLDFDVTSLSGTDYRDRIVPVPEAGTALPVLAALAALAWRRR